MSYRLALPGRLSRLRVFDGAQREPRVVLENARTSRQLIVDLINDGTWTNVVERYYTTVAAAAADGDDDDGDDGDDDGDGDDGEGGSGSVDVPRDGYYCVVVLHDKKLGTMQTFNGASAWPPQPTMKQALACVLASALPFLAVMHGSS